MMIKGIHGVDTHDKDNSVHGDEEIEINILCRAMIILVGGHPKPIVISHAAGSGIVGL